MPAALSKSPFDFLLALAIAAVVMGTSFVVRPATTEWIVFGVGASMFISVLAVALKPVRDRPLPKK